jgi:hypothetical protein
LNRKLNGEHSPGDALTSHATRDMLAPMPASAALARPPHRALSILAWTAVALLGAVALGWLALSRGEPVSAAWLLVAAHRALAR